MEFQSTITKEEINKLDLKKCEGSIELIDQEDQIAPAFEIINKYEYAGFDTETKPVFVKGQYNHISLIQISVPGHTFLIRTSILGVSDEVCDFFENENILKLGVALADDIRELRKLREFTPRAFYEINELVKGIGIESNGLRNLTATILGFRISKNAQVSNWEAPVLEDRQIDYAATDSWVCLEMYEKLTKLKLL